MSEEQKQRIYKIIMLVVLTGVFTFILTSVYNYNTMNKNKYVYVSQNDDGVVASLSSIKRIIDKKFMGEIDEQAVTDGALKGYVQGLGDKYTVYMTKDEMKEFTTEVNGSFCGVGISFTKDVANDCILIVSTIKDTPAYKAGIKEGDILTKVDDVEVKAEDFDTLANKIQGVEGTKVKLEILRDDQTLTFDLERQSIKVNHVESEMLENNIGYIEFNTFDDGCSKEFKTKLDDLISQNMKGLIIDIRDNGGGIVREALEIADFIVEKDKTLLITVDRNNNEEIEKAKEDPIINVPIVFLTNGNTASASEILAGALRDNEKAKIVGEVTYGKGVIQELLTLSDGSGLKITTNEYFTPNRTKINKIGITPDYEVDLPERDEKGNIKDTQLEKAIELLK